MDTNYEYTKLEEIITLNICIILDDFSNKPTKYTKKKICCFNILSTVNKHFFMEQLFFSKSSKCLALADKALGTR